MVRQFVLAYLVTLELLQLVDLNVLRTTSVLKMKLAVTKNAAILVLEHVESMPNVKLSITIQSAVAHRDILVILS
jgi:hypothetical protein